jgi:RNA polymerase sigma-70 factor (sigma-E family)
MARDEDFTAFVIAAGSRLRRTAFLMTGNWHEAEDVTQSALARLYVAWPRVRVDRAEAYARTVLIRTVIDARRRFWRRERPTGDLPDVVVPAAASPEDRLDLAQALAGLPVGQRAVVVLRFWEDWSVDEVATALAISPGTVKSRSSRALEALRLAMHADAVLTGEGQL